MNVPLVTQNKCETALLEILLSVIARSIVELPARHESIH